MSKNNDTPPEPILRVPQDGDIPEIIEKLGQDARRLWNVSKMNQAEADKAQTEYQQWHALYVTRQAEVREALKNATAAWAAYCQHRHENGYTPPEPLEDRNGEDVDLTNTTVDVNEFFEDITRAEELPGKL